VCLRDARVCEDVARLLMRSNAGLPRWSALSSQLKYDARARLCTGYERSLAGLDKVTIARIGWRKLGVVEGLPISEGAEEVMS
jgi:hypothetical protein